MRFYKKKGKQILDLRGNFILSKNEDLIETNARSSAPKEVKFARYVPKIHELKFRGKIVASWRALQFIWTDGQV